MTTILGLDISSTTIGVAIIKVHSKDHIDIYKSAYIKPIKDENIFKRLQYVQEEIIKLLDIYKPDIIAIEDIAQYMPHRSSANTIITLAVFNRTVGLTVYNHTGKKPRYFPVITIRSSLKLDKQLPQKEEMPKLVATYLKNKINFEELGKKGNIKAETYDKADAAAVALCAAIKYLKGELKNEN